MQGYLTGTYFIAVYSVLCSCFSVFPNRFPTQYAPQASVYNPPRSSSVQKKRSLAVQQ